MTSIRDVLVTPSVYDQISAALGLQQSCDRLRIHLQHASDRLVLDVGAGTGHYVHLLPASSRYVWLDRDQNNLRRFGQKHPSRAAILSDARAIPLRDKCVDYTLSVALFHHLDDEALSDMLREVARVTRERVVFLDALSVPDSKMSRLLWSLDRGHSPRTRAVLLANLSRWFDLDQVESYATYHTYLLCAGRPRPSTG